MFLRHSSVVVAAIVLGAVQTMTACGDNFSPGPVAVFTVILENHDYDEIVGSPNAPFVNALIERGALATNYYDTQHPSMGNYLHLISGDNQNPGGITVGPKDPPYFPSAAQNLGQQLDTAGISWRAYMESMVTPCNFANNGLYAVRHNPFVYFKNMQDNQTHCEQTNVDFTEFGADVESRKYQYMWITPNLRSDGHDPVDDPAGTLKNSDEWVAQEVTRIMNTPAYQDGGVLFLTWDEGAGHNGRVESHHVPMIVVSPRLKSTGVRTDVRMNHSSYLATIEDLLGLPRLPTVASAPSMIDLFKTND
jgi:phosphatidylinositol-3-phosphatase